MKKNKKFLKNNTIKLILAAFMSVSLSCHAELGASGEEGGYYINLKPEISTYGEIYQRNADKVFENPAVYTVLKKMDNVPYQLSSLAYGNFRTPSTHNKSSQKSVNQEQNPIIVEADDLFYDDESGDIVAYGNVVIVNDGNVIKTSEVKGNAKFGTIQTKENEKVFFNGPGTSVVTSGIVYNYNEGTGSLAETKGKVDKYFVQGKRIEIYPDRYVIYSGMATRCPAEKPDYKLTAERIEIYPEDKLLAYNVNFWIKNTIIYSLPKHQRSLKDTEEDYSLPRIGRSDHLGFYVKQKLEYPINSNTVAKADINYYSKHGFRSGFEIAHGERWFDVSVSTGYYIDWDDRWIRKSPEFRLNFHERKLGSTPLNYSFSASYGKWKDDHFSSWHGQYLVYVTHDPIKISNSTRLYLGAGVEWITETYDHSSQSAPRFDVTLSKNFSKKLNTFVSYNYRDYGDKALFTFDTPDAKQQLTYGLSYKIDSKNTIGVALRYDLENNYHKDINYFYYRDLHCWETLLMYKSKEKVVEWHITVKRW